MKFLFATGRTHPPDRVEGGAELSVHTLLGLLTEKGHPCEAVVALRAGWRQRMARSVHFLTARQWVGLGERHNGYQTYRTARGLVPRLVRHRLAEFHPDVVLTQLDTSSKIVDLTGSAGIATLVMVRDAMLGSEKLTRFGTYRHLKLVSNSEFVAGRVKQQLGMNSPVVYPVIRLEDYRLAKRAPEFITLINPVPQKGLDLVLSIAGLLPRRAFLLVESWSLGAQALRRLYERLKNYPNVTFVRWTAEMKSVYFRTAVLLIPSQWEESFARVALEAQVSGIPVVARDIGGMGEVLRDSGILLPQNAAAQAWAQTIERLLSDQSFYGACSAAANINAGRPEFDPFHQVDRFLAIATELTAK